MILRAGCNFVCGMCGMCVYLTAALCETVVATERGESLDDLHRKAIESKSWAGDEPKTAFTDPYFLDCLQAASDKLSMPPILLHALRVREFDAFSSDPILPSIATNRSELRLHRQHMGRFNLCVNFAAGGGTSLEQRAMDPRKTNLLLLSILKLYSMRHEDAADIVTRWMAMDGRAKPVRRTTIPVPLHLIHAPRAT
jgi:hypothetical protein